MMINTKVHGVSMIIKLRSGIIVSAYQYCRHKLSSSFILNVSPFIVDDEHLAVEHILPIEYLKI